MAPHSGGCAAAFAARDIAMSDAPPGSATSSTKPQSWASAAEMRWSARITACLVRAGPIRCSMRGTLCQLMFMPRSEEHTSELQSHLNLVCRLLLEKKKHAD